MNVILIVASIIFLIAVAAGWRAHRRGAGRTRPTAEIPLMRSSARTRAPAATATAPAPRAAAPKKGRRARPTPPTPEPVAEVVATAATPAAAEEEETLSRWQRPSFSSSPIPGSSRAPRNGDGDGASERERPEPAAATALAEPDLSQEKTVQFRRARDEPLHILPGRFEVVEGEGLGQEIRFVQTPGEPTQYTLGRDAGPPNRHVRLQSLTVSRMHARITFRSRQWIITNLSETNPVSVNDTGMEGVGDCRVLADGDRIELGEIVLRFRAQ